MYVTYYIKGAKHFIVSLILTNKPKGTAVSVLYLRTIGVLEVYMICLSQKFESKAFILLQSLYT